MEILIGFVKDVFWLVGAVGVCFIGVMAISAWAALKN